MSKTLLDRIIDLECQIGCQTQNLPERTYTHDADAWREAIYVADTRFAKALRECKIGDMRGFRNDEFCDSCRMVLEVRQSLEARCNELACMDPDR